MAINRSFLRAAQISNTAKRVWDMFLDLYDDYITTVSAAELAALDGAAAANNTAGKVAILGTGGAVTFGGAVTAAGSFIIGSADMSESDLEKLDGITNGTQAANKAVVTDANVNSGVSKVTQLWIGATGAEVQVASTPAQLDAAVAGTPLVYRTNVTAAQVNAGVTPVVPAVAGKRFQVMHISMAAAGGNVSGPTTVEVVEETAGTVFLSHITADLTDGVWHNLVTGTPVSTGMTNGGMTSADNKALLVTKSGGTDFATATGLDVIVVGYYTTT